jgi:hypothetical protein
MNTTTHNHYIDVHDLPKEQVGTVRAFIDFLRTRRKNEALPDIQWTALSESSLEKDWDNEDDAVYDDWQNHYEVSTR